MTPGIIERSAKALYESQTAKSDTRFPSVDVIHASWEQLNDSAQEFCRSQVRAILTELHDAVTEEMLKVIVIELLSWAPKHDDPRDIALCAFQAAIKTALSENLLAAKDADIAYMVDEANKLIDEKAEGK